MRQTDWREGQQRGWRVDTDKVVSKKDIGSGFSFPEAEAKVVAKSRVVGSGRGRNGEMLREISVGGGM